MPPAASAPPARSIWISLGLRSFRCSHRARWSSPAISRVHPSRSDHAGCGTGKFYSGARDVVATRIASAGLSGLVNNAGFALAGPLELLPIADLRRQLEVNVIGQVAVSQAFLPLLRQGRGRIVNMSSIAGRAATPFLGPYCASKFALEAVSDALRSEVRPWGITVSLVEPGAVQSEIWERSKTHAEAALSQTRPEQLALYKIQLEKLRELMIKVQRRAIPAVDVAKVVAQL